MRQVHPLCCARRGVQVQAELLAGQQLDLLVGERADAQLWALHIGHNADGLPCLPLNLTYITHPGGVVGVDAVAEVEPENIDACVMQLPDHLRSAAGGTKGSNNFAVATAIHVPEGS